MTVSIAEIMPIINTLNFRGSMHDYLTAEGVIFHTFIMHYIHARLYIYIYIYGV